MRGLGKWVWGFALLVTVVAGVAIPVTVTVEEPTAYAGSAEPVQVVRCSYVNEDGELTTDTVTPLGDPNCYSWNYYLREQCAEAACTSAFGSGAWVVGWEPY